MTNVCFTQNLKIVFYLLKKIIIIIIHWYHTLYLIKNIAEIIITNQ